MTENQIQSRSEIRGKERVVLKEKHAIVSLLVHTHAVNADISSVNTISAVQE